MTSLEVKEKDDIDRSQYKMDDFKVSELERAPDGQWGWVVVFASFMVHVLIDGVTYSFGALATEFVAHFDASREAVGWMASVLVGMTLACGPIVSILCNKCGYRAVTTVGAILSSAGFVAPFFYSEFWFLYLSASVVAGIGFSFVYLPAIVMVNVYFQKKRALAIGLAVCGSGIGTFVFSPLIEYFNEMYSWQGSMLLVGGLLLNCIACGAIYKSLPVVERDVTILNLVGSLSYLQETKEFSTNDLRLPNIHDIPQLNKSLDGDLQIDSNVRLSLQYVKEAKYFSSAPNIQRLPQTSKNAQKNNDFRVFESTQKSLQMQFSQRSNEVHSSLSPHYSTNGMKSCIKTVINTDLLRNPIFMIFAFSNFFNSIGYNAPFLYANDRALEMGVPRHLAVFLISSIGIGNTLGRIIFGYLSTKPFVNRFQLYTISVILSGIVVIFSSLALSYSWMVVYTMAFGLLTGTYVTLTSVVLVDLLGIDKLNESFGMLLFFQAVGIFIGPPIAGWIFDQTNSFDCSFWFCGAFLTLSGMMLYFVTCIKRYRGRKS